MTAGAIRILTNRGQGLSLILICLHQDQNILAIPVGIVTKDI